MKTPQLTFLTNRNRRIWVRPMTCQDAPLLIDIFAHLSPESRYMRFHESLESPDQERIEKTALEIASLKPDQGRGWLAFANIHRRRTPVGGVRWVRVDAESAEIALTIRDDFQGQGIGSELLRLAVLDADASGIAKIVAVIQGANHPITQLLRRSPVPLHKTVSGGEIYVEIDLKGSGIVESLREQASAVAV